MSRTGAAGGQYEIVRGRSYVCTDPDFNGVVKVTEVGEVIFYTGDADGHATREEFLKSYEPAW